MSRRVLTKKIVLRSLYTILFIVYVLTVAFTLKYMDENTHTEAVNPEDAKVIVPAVLESVPTVAPTVGVPVRLTIPKINVSAAIDSVGVTGDGTMDIKQNPSDVAWYKLGARPGNVGSAVIAGHYGWDGGRGSVFNELHTLRAGDEIIVTDEQSATKTFIVRESRQYNPNADASIIFRSGDGKSHLNLITCEGSWNRSQQTYSGRLVVFTDLK